MALRGNGPTTREDAIAALERRADLCGPRQSSFNAPFSVAVGIPCVLLRLAPLRVIHSARQVARVTAWEAAPVNEASVRLARMAAEIAVSVDDDLDAIPEGIPSAVAQARTVPESMVAVDNDELELSDGATDPTEPDVSVVEPSVPPQKTSPSGSAVVFLRPVARSPATKSREYSALVAWGKSIKPPS